MSRSNPTENAPNPATRWFEWNGEQGSVRYYDKDAKRNVDCGLPFTFILLDELGTVRGWHEPSQSGIYANEVRDTREDLLVVKSFKGGSIAEGLYKDIKDRVAAAGGQFVANCYIAFKRGESLAIGSMRFKGAALGAWMDFRKNHRAELYKKAIEIQGFEEGKKGRVIFRVPTFGLKDISEQSNQDAIALDRELQEFMSAYLKRTKRDQTEHTSAHEAPVSDSYEPPYQEPVSMPDDSDIPF